MKGPEYILETDLRPSLLTVRCMEVGRHKNIEEVELENIDKVEGELNILVHYLCNEVTKDLIEKFVDEIVDEEALALQKWLLMEKVSEFDNPHQ